jgi:hypothetical protein
MIDDNNNNKKFGMNVMSSGIVISKHYQLPHILLCSAKSMRGGLSVVAEPDHVGSLVGR